MKLYAYYDQSPLRTDPGYLPGDSWVQWVAARKDGWKKFGVDGIFIRMPFGVEKDVNGTLHLNQYGHCRIECPAKTEDFVDAWAPIAASGLDLNFYTGSLHFLQIHRPASVDSYLSEALRPFIESGGSVTFDASCDAVPGTSAWDGLMWCRSKGIKTGVEAWIPADNPSLFGANWCVADAFRRTVTGQLAAKSVTWPAPLASLTGQRLCLCNTPPNGADWNSNWTPGVVAECKAAGFDAAVYVEGLLQQGVTRQGLGL